MRYNRTSLAYKVEEYSEVDTLVKEAKKENTKKNKNSTLFMFICIVYMISIVASLLIKTANITEQRAELTAIKSEYNEILNINKKMEVDINSQIDLRKVEEIAIARLNMNQPKKSQIVYITTEPKDYGEVMAEETGKRKDGNIFASLIKSLNGYFAYSN